MEGNKAGVQEYEMVKIGFELCFIEALKVWDNTRSLQLAILTFFIPFVLYLVVNGIQSYLHRKALLESGIDMVDTMWGEEFEELLLAYYINLGYTGKTTPKTGDYGADLVLEKDNQRIVVQAKRWKNVVGIEAVQQIIGAIKYYGAAKGMVVTNSVFAGNAHDLARVNGIELIDRQGLIEIMRKSHGKDVSAKPSEMERHQTEQDNGFGILPEKTCPLCGRTLVRRNGKYGAFIGCSGFPACRFTKPV